MTNDDRSSKSGRRISNPLSLALLILAMVLTGIAGVLIFLPFWKPLLLAAVFTTLGYPLHARMLKLVKGHRRALASALTCVVFLSVVLGPLSWAGWQILGDADIALGKVTAAARVELRHRVARLDELAKKPDDAERSFEDELLLVLEPLIRGLNEVVSEDEAPVSIVSEPVQIPTPPNVEGGVDRDEKAPQETEPARDDREISQSTYSRILTLTGWVTRRIADLLAGILGLLIKFLLMVFLMFYFFKDGENIVASIRRALPMESAVQGEVIETFRKVSRSVVRGTLGTALAQGVLATIAFAIVGLPSYLFWGAMAGVCGLLPVVGTAVVTLPVTLVLLLQALDLDVVDPQTGFKVVDPETGDSVTRSLWNADLARVVFMAVVATVIGVLDNFLRPLLMTGDLRIHPVWLFLSFLGGLSAFGPVGVVLGPIIVGPAEVWRILGHPPPSNPDPRFNAEAVYASYRRRRVRAEYRVLSHAPGPHKTAEGYIMEYHLIQFSRQAHESKKTQGSKRAQGSDETKGREEEAAKGREREGAGK